MPAIQEPVDILKQYLRESIVVHQGCLSIAQELKQSGLMIGSKNEDIGVSKQELNINMGPQTRMAIDPYRIDVGFVLNSLPTFLTYSTLQPFGGVVSGHC